MKYYTNYLITMSVLVLILPLEITNKQIELLSYSCRQEVIKEQFVINQ